MGFRNPIVVADLIRSGNFDGAYTINGSFTIGDPAHAHVIIGRDLHGADGLRIYAADGTTPLIDLNIGGISLPGGSVVGPVPAATDLAGGGTASGVTTIAGRMVIGDPAGAHVVVGTDGNGADGVRLYGSDGVTPLIDLTISGTPTITSTDIIAALISGGTIETSANPADARVVIDANGIRAYDDSGSGIPIFEVDLTGGVVAVTAIGEVFLGGGAQLGPVGGVFHAGHGTDHILKLLGPANGAGQSASIEMRSGTNDGVFPQKIILDATDISSDANGNPQLVTLDAGLVANTLLVRRIGNIVHFIGYASIIGGGDYPTGAVVTIANAGGIPGNYVPGRTVIAAAAHTFGGGAVPSTCRVTVNPDGSMVVMNVQQTGVKTVWFDGVSYWI